MREILDRLQSEQNERCAPLDFHRGFADAIARVRAALGEPLPDGLALPADAEAAYRTLTAAGFTRRALNDAEKGKDGNCGLVGVWVAPNDEPLTTELILAVATLQEHGFGPVVSK